MEPEILSAFEKTTKLNRKLGDLVTNHEYPADPKSQILLAYQSILVGHHAAIALLIQNELYGSAFALVRPFYEPLCRAHWLIRCATDKQMDEAIQGKDIFPKMNNMVKEIDAGYCTGSFFQNIKENSWCPMNDYTHCGIRQIGRRFKGNKVEPNYGKEEIVEVLNGINIALMLMALLFFKTFKKIEAANAVEKMLTEYASKND